MQQRPKHALLVAAATPLIGQQVVAPMAASAFISLLQTPFASCEMAVVRYFAFRSVFLSPPPLLPSLLFSLRLCESTQPGAEWM